MAAATITNRKEAVIGNLRIITALGTISNTNTWATGLKVIRAFSADPPDANALGATISGGTLTFATTGTETGVSLMAIGL